MSCTSLTDIIFGNNITSISNHFDNSIWYKNKSDGIVLAGNALYKYKGSPTGTVYVPSIVNIMCPSCFGSKTSEFQVVLHDGVKTISQGCFYCSNGLKSINLDNVEKTLYQSLVGCYKIEKLVLSKIISIDGGSFAYCTSLKYIYINNNVVPNLQSTYAFDGTTCKFYVLDNLVDSYKIATNWSTYADRILPISQFATDFPNG